MKPKRSERRMKTQLALLEIEERRLENQKMREAHTEKIGEPQETRSAEVSRNSWWLRDTESRQEE